MTGYLDGMNTSRTVKRLRIGPSMARALAFIAAHPGTTRAEVDRHCRTAKGGHQWIYAAIARLIRARLVRECAPLASLARGGARGLREEHVAAEVERMAAEVRAARAETGLD